MVGNAVRDTVRDLAINVDRIAIGIYAIKGTKQQLKPQAAMAITTRKYTDKQGAQKAEGIRLSIECNMHPSLHRSFGKLFELINSVPKGTHEVNGWS